MTANQARTVFVVGAGASAEIGLPVGSELKGRIEKALTGLWNPANPRVGSNSGQLQSGFDSLIAELSEGRRDSSVWRSCKNASDSIAANMALAQSIDSFIDIRRDDPYIPRCGKLVLAHTILEAEKSSSLFLREDGREWNGVLKKLNQTWYAPFVNLLTRGCTFAELPARLSLFVVITFNYDRCIEVFLRAAVVQRYGVSEKDAIEALKSLRIFHPYGYLGDPSLEDAYGTAPIKYGELAGGSSLLQVSKQLKTFTEGVDPTSSEVCAIRKVFLNTDQVVFLGFAFNDANLDLLEFDKSPAHFASLPGFASGLKLSTSNIAKIRSLLHTKLGISSDSFFIADETCYETLNNHGKHLGLG